MCAAGISRGFGGLVGWVVVGHVWDGGGDWGRGGWRRDGHGFLSGPKIKPTICSAQND
jgi:hypothetical protein